VRFPGGILAVAAIAAIGLTARAGEVKTNIPAFANERLLVKKPDPTTAGSFDGTWMYINRDGRYALWLRTKDGVPQAKVQYQSLASPESFETDWDGKAVYYLGGSPVTFELKLGACDPNQLLGTWTWLLQIDQSARKETADLVVNRTAYGRSLLMDFQNYTKTITREGKDQVFKPPVAWTWTKVSKRELLWDELPF